jgi:hypothetical protein
LLLADLVGVDHAVAVGVQAAEHVFEAGLALGDFLRGERPVIAATIPAAKSAAATKPATPWEPATARRTFPPWRSLPEGDHRRQTET